MSFPRVIGPAVLGGGGGVDADAQAWANQVVTNGGTVSGGRLTLVSDMVTSLKADGLWTLIDRLALYAAENTQSALTDIKSLTLQTVTGGPAFVADRGYTSSASAYVNTGFNPSTGTPVYAQNSAHFSFYNRTNKGASDTVEMGSSGAGDFMANLSVKWSDGNSYTAINDNNFDSGRAAAVNTSGFWTVSRPNGVDPAAIYQNGASFGTLSQATTGIPNRNFVVGGALNSSGVFSFGSTCQFAAATIGGGLSSTQAANLRTAIQTYMTAVGA